MRESSIVNKFRKILKEEGWFVIKFHGSIFSVSGIPDTLSIKQGIYVWIEFKRKGEVPTKLQDAVQTQLKRVSAMVFTCDNSDDAVKIAQKCLEAKRG